MGVIKFLYSKLKKYVSVPSGTPVNGCLMMDDVLLEKCSTNSIFTGLSFSHTQCFQYGPAF